MSETKWAACFTKLKPISLNGEIVRVVESQEKVATNDLVDTLEEQALLEDMLDNSKPPVPVDSAHLAYLLFTPFRYPPLKYGSRFGGRFQPGLFYASRTLVTAFAEVAYYRLLFWFDMTVPPPNEKLKTQHTAFTAAIKTNKGLQLQTKPFSDFENHLLDKKSYRESQDVGTLMREHNIEAFEYISARDKNKGVNVGLFNASAFNQPGPTSIVNVFCSTNKNSVEFMDDDSKVYQYPLDDFLVDNNFPRIQI